MTGNEYQKAAIEVCRIPYNDKQEMINHAVFGLTSEAGEVAGIFQKYYQGHEIVTDHVKKELGDCLWMLTELCTAMELDLEDVMQTNLDKLKARYPNGFNSFNSKFRAESDI